jgi:hypothetical protein
MHTVCPSNAHVEHTTKEKNAYLLDLAFPQWYYKLFFWLVRTHRAHYIGTGSNEIYFFSLPFHTELYLATLELLCGLI